MTPQQISLIAETWTLLAPSAGQFTALFYQRLEKLDPGLRKLFPADPEQSKWLASLLDTVVATLDLMDNLMPALQAMGRRNGEQGVTARDYRLAEEALLWTLDQALGQRFTAAERDAWSTAFDTLTAVMLQAAATAAPDEPPPHASHPADAAVQLFARQPPGAAPGSGRQ